MPGEGSLENDILARAAEAREVFWGLLECLVKRVGEAAEVSDEHHDDSDRRRSWAEARAKVIADLLNGTRSDSKLVDVVAYASGGQPMEWSRLRRYNAYRTVAAAFGWCLSDEEARRKFGRKQPDNVWDLDRHALGHSLREQFGDATDDNGYTYLVNSAQNFFEHVAKLEKLVKRKKKISSLSSPGPVTSAPPVTMPKTVQRHDRKRGALILLSLAALVSTVSVGWWWYCPNITIASIAGKAAIRETNAIQALVKDFANQPENRWTTVELRVHERRQVKGNQEKYLRGSGVDDVIPWEAGERATPYVSRNLLSQIEGPMWNALANNWYESVGESFGQTGEYHYVVPFKTYVWAFYYRISEWKVNKYFIEGKDGKQEPPKDWDELVEVAKRMHDKGQIPIAFGNADLWPALGTFDILNMRMNGFDFHKQLLEGRKKWTDPAAKAVFVKWQELIPFYRKKGDMTSRPWEAGDDKTGTTQLKERAAGMYFIGGFILGDIQDKADIEDIGVFTFPIVDVSKSGPSAHDANDAVDAPIDGFVIPSKPGIVNISKSNAAKRFIRYLGTEHAFKVYDEQNQGGISVCKELKPTEYRTEVQRQAAQILSTASGKIARFLDRATEPGFAKQCLMPRLADFLRDQTKIDEMLANVQNCRDRLPLQAGP